MTPEKEPRAVMVANANRWGKEAVYRIQQTIHPACPLPRSFEVLAVDAIRTAARFAFLARPDLKPPVEGGGA